MSCGCNGLHGHPHTVRASAVPLYLRGATLGQDAPVIDDTSIATPDVSAIMPAPVDPLIASGFSPGDAATISDLASKGWLSQQDWNDLFAGNVTASELSKINYDAAAAQSAQEAAATAAAATKAATGVVKALTPAGSKASPAPGPSPRVSAIPAASGTSWFSSGTSIGGTAIPNWLLLAGGVLILGSGMLGRLSGPSLSRPKIKYRPYLANGRRR